MLQENVSLKKLIDTFQEIDNEIVDRGGTKTITPSTTNQVLEKGYYKGNITVNGDINLKPENIKKGVSLFGLVGNCEEGVLETVGWKNIREGQSVDSIKKGDPVIFEQLIKGESSFISESLNLHMIIDIYGGDSVSKVAISPNNNFMVISVYSSDRASSNTVFLEKNKSGKFEKLPNPGIVRGIDTRYLKFSNSSKNLATADTDYYKVPKFSSLCMYYIDDTNNFIKVAIPTPKRERLKKGTFEFSDDLSTIIISELIESGSTGVSNSIEIYEFYNSKWNLVFETDSVSGIKLRFQGNSNGDFIVKSQYWNYVFVLLKNGHSYTSSIYNDDLTIYKGFGDWINSKNYIATGQDNSDNFLKLYTINNNSIQFVKTFNLDFSIMKIYRTIWENYFILEGRDCSYLYKIENNELIKIFQFNKYNNDVEFAMSENYIATYDDYYNKESVDLYKYFINKENKFEVKPLSVFDPNLKFNNQQIGVALEDVVKGQQVKVNVFNKIKL